jgi:predicted metal-dependent HD superfamily phosphohydrolase
MKLRDRFDALMRRLGAAGDQSSLFARLIAAYAEPHRAYHSTAHLVDCLERLDEAAPPGTDRDVVEAAVWFHDAIYDSKRDDNEARSARWAEQAAAEAGMSPATGQEIGRLVRLTRHVSPPTDPRGQLITDVDLSILGREPREFERYEQQIRSEYAWVEEPAYRMARAAILARLLSRDPLFRIGTLHQRYEERARRNLRQALERLRQPER